MVYPEFKKGESVCAHCEKELCNADEFNYRYLTVRENYLVINFFQFEDGQDNMFCDEYCLAKYLTAETISVEVSE